MVATNRKTERERKKRQEGRIIHYTQWILGAEMSADVYDNHPFGPGSVGVKGRCGFHGIT